MQIIMTACVAWFIAQLIKILIEYVKTKKFNLGLFIASGGMPSSHTAFIVAATAKIALVEGMYSSLFGACVILSFVIMYDAVGVRQSVGIQAKALNELHTKLSNIANIDCNLIKEVCGHNILQVIAGLVLGVIVGLLV